MKDIIDTILVDGDFKNLFAAVQAAELIDTLREPGPWTLFAPMDYAFAKLPKGKMDELMKDPPKLKALLMYHIIEGQLTVEAISKMKKAITFQGQEVMIDAHQWHLHVNPKINHANIKSSILVDNGVIHVLDEVLMPNMELTCPICGAGFLTMEVMDIHTKTAHAPEKITESMLETEQAPKEDRFEEEHMSGESNPIRCPVCGRAFKTKSEMERHKDSVHNETRAHDE